MDLAFKSDPSLFSSAAFWMGSRHAWRVYDADRSMVFVVHESRIVFERTVLGIFFVELVVVRIPVPRHQ